MNNYFIKLRLVWLPFLYSLLILLIGYTFLNWLLVIKLEWISINEEAINIFIPAAIAVLLLIVIIRPSFRQLYFKSDKGIDFMYFMAFVGIVIPSIIAQLYISAAAGELTRLNDIYEIDHLPKTKYYTLKNYYFYKEAASVTRRFEVSGKHNEYLNFKLYYVVPILKTMKETENDSTHYFLCTEYQDQVRSSLSDMAKEQAFTRFVNESESQFRQENFRFQFLERIGKNNSDIKYYQKAIKYNDLESNGEAIFLSPRDYNFEQRNGAMLPWIFKSAGIGLVVFGLLLLFFRLKTKSELSKLQKKIVREKARGWKKNYEWLFPHEGFFSTMLLLYANVLVFAFMVFSGMGFISFDGSDLVAIGSLYKRDTLNGDWWRLVTSQFLHGGLIHIINNLFSLFLVGLFVEPILGKWRLLLVYLVCGIGGGLTSLWWHEQLNGVGASGAIFGLYGFMLAMGMMKVTTPEHNKLFFWLASISLGFSLLMGLIGNTDNAAHIGGLIVGFLIGLLLTNRIKEELDNSQT